jgi:hypothetical protein
VSAVDDQPDGPGAMYDAARAALLGTTRGNPAQQPARRGGADALERLAEPAVAPEAAATRDEPDRASGQGEQA